MRLTPLRHLLPDANHPHSDGSRGSISVIFVGAIAALLSLTLGLAAVADAFLTAERARAVADLAALAGGQAQSDPIAGKSPCKHAHSVAQRNGAAVVRCREFATSVQVTVRLNARVGHASAVARAGQVQP